MKAHPPSPSAIERPRGRRAVRAVAAGAVVALTATLAVLGAGPAAAAPATSVAGAAVSAPTSCPTVFWGSKAKNKVSGYTSRTIKSVRAGSHPCYDRVVIDLGAGSPKVSYRVKYVDTVRQDGSGKAVKLSGGAKLQVIAVAAAYNSDTGKPTYQPKNPNKLVDTTGFRTVRQVAFAGSFEGQTTFGIGVRARLPFRVQVLNGPGTGQRLVIDIARNW